MATAPSDKLKLELRRGVLALAVLALLREPHYGYSLRQQLQESGIDIDEGTLYPLVRRLADQGLLENEWKHSGGRERRYYQLSTLGHERLNQLTQEWRALNHALMPLLTITNHEER